ncbi:DUF4340 domain-containing protein [Aquipseudomonas alcaligenes]|uniref:DUF4340 domain-containing protein n=1 Tax=Aquipseudomonas alcaligenes TaxID=43263 RepID=A0AA37CF22_AQUAC|nr:DUF4340 domain-containing protein [Pseudomonas alcaligenes]BCR25721.1 hypothetical protein KAM426_32480 [Pseudomonas alcaligenes]GIZ66270.1 hypothetical protein KAM428_13550 [Pseudomonas alcaligenes]GIZ70603.1 hypothetical protein KAM429_13640 [Pseudomonas alcaligenes]GIZ74957.1 hypothetical protein KAM430_13660 [Pseudomonas alcaligenes]GIZ79284.1 hypothetical protein KAM432_13320 [Pseudomonas alcaligenes]
MNRKTLFVLAVLALALVAGWYFTSQVGLPRVPAQAERWLPGVQVAQVKAIEVQRGDQPLVRLERREQGWVVPAKADYPADQGVVNKLLKALAEARKVEPRTANPELYGRLGLADKGEAEERAVRLTLEQGEAPLRLLIGKPGQQEGQLVRRADEAQSWLVSQRIELPASELDWLDRRVTAIPFAEVRELDLRHAGGERLTLARDKAEEANLQVRDLPKGKRLAFDGAANGFGQFFADLRFADSVPLAQLGFEGKPALEFSLTTFAGKTLKGRFYGKADQHWLLLEQGSGLSASEVPGRSDWAYRVEPYQYQSLVRKLTELLAKE